MRPDASHPALETATAGMSTTWAQCSRAIIVGMRQWAARWRVFPCRRAPWVWLWLSLCAWAAQAMPPEVDLALQRARVPHDAVAVLLQEAGTGRTLLSHNAQTAVNPASLAKLLTTLAALDQLGPAWTWSTPVWLQGSVSEGVLDGSLVIKGTGDPEAGGRARVAAAAPRAAVGRARDPWRHRARPQRLCTAAG